VLNKGFIGPIGDDLPSLIPLLFGLVMFFSTFTLTFNSFDRGNAEFNDEISVMRIARVLQSNSYIYDINNFYELCDEIGVVNMDFVAGISSQATDDSAPLIETIFDTPFYESVDTSEYFFCTNTGVDSPNPKISDFLSLGQAIDLKLILRIFPIVVEDDKIVKPMHLFVVAWK